VNCRLARIEQVFLADTDGKMALISQTSGKSSVKHVLRRNSSSS
jgi:hypothetical protein